MRYVTLVSAALCVLLWTSVEAQGQAGRYVPVPHIPAGGGGGMPHIPIFHGSGGGDSDGFWVIAAIVGVIILAVIGWNIGQSLGQRKSPADAAQAMSSSVPPLEDLILQPAEVDEKARKTTRLLKALAKRDAAFDPAALRVFIGETFHRVQHCWAARDYSPIRELLGPSILAQHEELLRAMRRNREINRIDNLCVLRLEFVHLFCPAEANRHEVTALITFEAKVYFVNEYTGAFLRGSPTVIPYQEFWVFRRDGDSWRLATIDRSHESDRLTAANDVVGMTDQERCDAEEGVHA